MNFPSEEKKVTPANRGYDFPSDLSDQDLSFVEISDHGNVKIK